MLKIINTILSDRHDAGDSLYKAMINDTEIFCAGFFLLIFIIIFYLILFTHDENRL